MSTVGAAALVDGQAPEYREKYRPQFHFTARKGWLNDPNGLVFYQGEYHLFFQHNPFGVKWGNMTWGHAISVDLVHWRQMENALLPDKLGTMFSGSAVIDWNNTTGFQRGPEKTMVVIYTAAGDTSPESKGQPFTQCIAYSNDRGRSWTKFAGNPVVPHIVGGNRDPKVIWHAPSRRWIMTLFLDGNTYGLLSSPDLKQWKLTQQFTVPGVAECPDFFEMAVEDEPGVTKWVWTGANNQYLVGSFDGQRFTPEVMTQPLSPRRSYYAVQTFAELPGGRRVQMAWMAGGSYPDMPFNQQMGCPIELKLRRQGFAGYQLTALPVHELDALRGAAHQWKDLTVNPGENPLARLTGGLWDVVAEIEPGPAKEVGFRAGGRVVCYRDKALHNGDASVPAQLHNGRLTLRMLVDRASIEVFANTGEVVLPACSLPEDGKPALELYANGGAARVVALDVYPLSTIWSAA